MTIDIGGFLWICLLFASSCRSPSNKASAQEAPTNLETARKLWASATKHNASDYTFEYLEYSNDTTSQKETFVVDVRDDVVTNVYPRQIPGLILGNAPNASDFPTIPDLFDMIEDANVTGSVEPIVEYDAKYGYPIYIAIEYNFTDFVEIWVSSLTPYTILEYELDTQVALWESYGELTDDYWFIIATMCFCPPDYSSPKLIVVENNTIVSTTDVATGDASDYTYDTIPELFQRIQSAIDSYQVQILVSYDEVLGYPTSISTNPAYGVMDAGIFIAVNNVTLGAL